MVFSAPEAHQGHLQPRHVGLYLRGARPPNSLSRCFRLLTPMRWPAVPSRLLMWHLASLLCRPQDVLKGQECWQWALICLA